MQNLPSFEFSEDGTGIAIRSLQKDGSRRSQFFSYKKTAFEAIVKLANESKISPKEFKEMRDAILEAPNLPWDENGSSAPIGVIEIEISTGMGSFADFLGSTIVEAMQSVGEKIPEEACFKMCFCGGNHGRIYGKDCMLENIIPSKEVGRKAVEYMRSEESVNDEEVARILQQIDDSSLPETEAE